MKVALLAVAMAGGLMQAGAQSPSPRSAPASRGIPAPFALVELFTSEGCSSCPLADALLSELGAQARAAGRRVFTLAFHVDYWDDLGWKDPFDDPAWSQRQRDYSDAFGSDRIYTPQMIVNGAQEFVGSRGDEARRRIDEALAQPASVAVALRVHATAPALPPTGSPAAPLRIDYDMSGAPARVILHVALVEDGLVSEVRREENRGRTLRHDAVVRALETVVIGASRAGSGSDAANATMSATTHATAPARGSARDSVRDGAQDGGQDGGQDGARESLHQTGRVELAVPAGVERSRARVIGFIQDASSGRVLGATATALGPA
jgi:hypothetical protein